MGTPLLRVRTFTEQDRPMAPWRIIVSKRVAVVLLASLGSCYLPAHQALRTDVVSAPANDQ